MQPAGRDWEKPKMWAASKEQVDHFVVSMIGRSLLVVVGLVLVVIGGVWIVA